MKKNLLFMLATTGLLAFQSCSSTEFASHLKNGDMVKAKPTATLTRADVQDLAKSTKLEVTPMNAIQTETAELNLSVSSAIITPVVSAPVFENTTIVAEKTVAVNENTITKFNKKEWKANLKKFKAENNSNGSNSSKVDQVIIILCAIFIPPLGVFLFDGIGTPFWISLILTLLFFVPGMIYSLLHVLGMI